jgi:hypothetical protein
VIPPMLCYLLLKSSKGLSSRPIDSASLVYAWREARNKEIPDYAEIVRQINTCLDEIRHRLNIGELTQMLLTTPIVELGTLLKKLEKIQPPVQQLNSSPEAFLDDPGIFVLIDDPN